MKYTFIANHTKEFRVSAMCHALEVSVSGYYAWGSRVAHGPSAHERADAALSGRIHAAFVAGRGVYGSLRIHATLRTAGIRCGRKRVARLMRTQGIRATRPRQRKPRTTDRQHLQSVAPNLLRRDFPAGAPNRRWVADITAIATRAGWLYLAALLYVHSRRVVG